MLLPNSNEIKKGSVWLKEVDTALVTLINNTITVPDELGVPQKVDVVVRDPEKEAKLTNFPCVSIYNYNQLKSKDRIDTQTKIQMKYEDSEKKSILVDKVAKPYYLFYQIDFYAKYQTDIDEMTRQWLGLIDQHYLLEVRDTKNNKRQCVMDELEYRYSNARKSIFQRTYNYKIWVELDESVPKSVPTVQEIILRR